MERLFTPINEQEKVLVDIIKTNTDAKKRKKAMVELKKLLGLSPSLTDLSIRHIEYYTHIQGKPSYFRRFQTASIMYDDSKLKR